MDLSIVEVRLTTPSRKVLWYSIFPQHTIDLLV